MMDAALRRWVAWIAGACALASACSLQRTEHAPTVHLSGVRVEHYRQNRCSDSANRLCTRDGDCPGSSCVSVLPTDAGAYGRDGGHTLGLNGSVLWQFGDSFTEAGLLSSTAAWSNDADPLSLRDTVGADGEPVAFLPMTPRERAFNRTHAAPPPCCFETVGCETPILYCRCPDATDCTQRLALWPGDGTAIAADTAIVYYDRQFVGVAPYDFRDAGVGVAVVAAGAASARRLMDPQGEPVWVFHRDEPHFTRGMRVAGSEGDHFYLYASTGRLGCAVDVLLARVPVASMAEREHFRFWDGRGWVRDVDAAQPIARSIVGGLGSVAWNEHIGAYLSVWSDICTGGNQLALRWAPQPQGPWSDAVLVDLASLGAGPDAYYGMQHPEFGHGRELVVSYFQPVGVVDGQLRLLRLILP